MYIAPAVGKYCANQHVNRIVREIAAKPVTTNTGLLTADLNFRLVMGSGEMSNVIYTFHTTHEISCLALMTWTYFVFGTSEICISQNLVIRWFSSTDTYVP
jgi:hypothetical protein